eukprot:755677-Hanusia_phi.AAC.8
MEKEGPCSLNAVARMADTDDPMDRVTLYGPTLFAQRGAWLRTASTVSIMSCTEAPPCPRMDAKSGLLWYSDSLRPESRRAS